LLVLKTGLLFVWQYVRGLVRWGLDKQNWKTIKMYLTMAQQLAEFSKKEKEAKKVGWLIKKFDDLTKEYSDEDTDKAADIITKAKGELAGLKLGYDIKTKKVNGSFGIVSADWDPSNGEVKFGLNI